MTGCVSGNAMAAEADVVLAVGTRLGDFVTGSWTVFGDEAARIIGLNAARFDAVKHRSFPLVADAREGLAELGAAVGDYRAPQSWSVRAASETAQYHAYIDKIAAPVTLGSSGAGNGDAPEDLPTYAQVVGAVDRAAGESTYVVTAAGGFPGELISGWRSQGSTPSTASTAIRAWGTRFRGPGGRRWPCPTAR